MKRGQRKLPGIVLNGSNTSSAPKIGWPFTGGSERKDCRRPM